MENEEKTKQAWRTPEIIDLDTDATAGKTWPAGAESDNFEGPS
nr:hypothetical protein [uncultured Draconibacterium sp.]